MNAFLYHGSTILIFVLVLAVLVLAHEFGHFLAARIFGIEVEEFGFGFPPRAAGFQKNGTIWSLNWVPLGGFVRLKGEDNPHVTGPGSFSHKPAAVRAVVIVAGVVMNLLLSSVLFSAGFMIGVPQIAEQVPAGARVRDRQVQIIEVLQGLPAEKAGLRQGDVIVMLDGRPFAAITAIQEYVNGRSAQPIKTEVRRGQDIVVEEITPARAPDTGKYLLGVALAETVIVSYPPHIALARGFAATAFYAKEIVVSVADLIKNLVIQQKSNVGFSGPVGIAVLTGRVARLGFSYLIQFVALLSVNLAVVNVLPIPALDGGRLLFIVIERFRGKAVRPKVEAALHKIAFFLLLLLVVLVTFSDLQRYGDQILQVLKSIFGVT